MYNDHTSDEKQCPLICTTLSYSLNISGVNSFWIGEPLFEIKKPLFLPVKTFHIDSSHLYATPLCQQGSLRYSYIFFKKTSVPALFQHNSGSYTLLTIDNESIHWCIRQSRKKTHLYSGHKVRMTEHWRPQLLIQPVTVSFKLWISPLTKNSMNLV